MENVDHIGQWALEEIPERTKTDGLDVEMLTDRLCQCPPLVLMTPLLRPLILTNPRRPQFCLGKLVCEVAVFHDMGHLRPFIGAGCVAVLTANLHDQNAVPHMEPPFRTALVAQPALGHGCIVPLERARHQRSHRLRQILLSSHARTCVLKDSKIDIARPPSS